MLVLRRSVNVWLFLNVQLQNNALSRPWHLLVSLRQIRMSSSDRQLIKCNIIVMRELHRINIFVKHFSKIYSKDQNKHKI